MNNNYCYFKGEITTNDKIKISPYDIGMLRGYGVFDVMCTQNGKAFLIKEHWERLENSAKTLGLKVPISFEKYNAIIQDLIKKNNFKKSGIRTVLTGGPSDNAFTPQGKETFYILIEEFGDLPTETFRNGASVITIDYNRNLPHAKITNYIMAIKHQEAKSKVNALEIIYTKDGNALEATTSNYFIVKNKKLVTTKDGILHGITRNLVIRLAKENSIEVIEREITKDELENADEVFLTASNKDVTPIIKVNNSKINNQEVGNTTRKIMELFDNFTKNY